MLFGVGLKLLLICFVWGFSYFLFIWWLLLLFGGLICFVGWLDLGGWLFDCFLDCLRLLFCLLWFCGVLLTCLGGFVWVVLLCCNWLWVWFICLVFCFL